MKEIIKDIQQTIQPNHEQTSLYELALFLLTQQGNSSQLVQKESNLSDSYFTVNSWYLDLATKKFLNSLLDNQSKMTQQLKKLTPVPTITFNLPIYQTRLIYHADYLILEFLVNYQTIYHLEKHAYYPITAHKKNHFKLMITSDLKFFYKNSNKDKWFVLTLSKFFNEMARFHSRQQLMFNHLLEFLGTKHLLFLDLVKEAKVRPLYLPYTFQQVFECQTKRELLQLSFKNMELPKRLNKEHLHIAYLLMKAKPYVIDQQWCKLFEIDFSQVDFRGYRSREQLQVLLKTYYIQKLGLIELQEDVDIVEDIVEDFIRMTFDYAKPKIFNLDIKSYRRLVEEHDRLSDQLREKETPVIKIPKDSRFKKLKLPKEFEEIKTRKRIIEESRIQRHCVWSYANKINRDQCRIYSIVREGERYTLEVVRRKDKFVANQIRGKGNQLPPKNLENEVCQLLDEQKVS